jgi:hypothetical protein
MWVGPLCGEQNTEIKSPMELIAEVPLIKVDARVVACEGGTHGGI